MAEARLNPDLLRITAASINRFAKHLKQTGYSGLAKTLIQQAADLELMSPELQICWGGPFNDQKGRTAIIEQILTLLKPSAVVETGTYRGITTQWLADHFAGPIWSCEKEELYFIQAMQRLEIYTNVHVELADSLDFLRRIVPKLDREAYNLFLLDSHWEQDLPLPEELRIIFAQHPKAVVVIDDFNVPSDTGYGWDNYGPSCSIEVSQLVGAISPTSSLYFPVLSSSDESGAKRRCCVVVGDSNSPIDDCDLLKKWPFPNPLPISSPKQEAEKEDSYIYQISMPNEDESTIYSSPSVRRLRQELHKLTVDGLYRIRVLTEQMALLQNDINVVRSERTLQLRDIDTLIAQVLSLQSEIDTIRSERKLHLRDIDTLNAQVLSLQSEIDTIRSERKLHLRDIDTLNAQVLSLQSEIDMLKSQRVQHLNDIDVLTNQLSICEEDRANRLTVIEALSIENKRLIQVGQKSN